MICTCTISIVAIIVVNSINRVVILKILSLSSYMGEFCAITLTSYVISKPRHLRKAMIQNGIRGWLYLLYLLSCAYVASYIGIDGGMEHA